MTAFCCRPSRVQQDKGYKFQPMYKGGDKAPQKGYANAEEVDFEEPVAEPEEAEEVVVPEEAEEPAVEEAEEAEEPAYEEAEEPEEPEEPEERR